VGPEGGSVRGKGLSVERIAAAALALVDREGLAALSMRKLAAELDVEAMSLYKHVANKAELLDRLVAAAVDDVDLPRGGSWQDRLRSVAAAYRRMGLAHPEVFDLVASCRSGAPATLEPMEAVLVALREGGFDDATAVLAFRALLAYVNGAVQGQIADEAAPGVGSMHPVSGGAGVELPTLADLAVPLAEVDYDEAFAFGLELLLAALGTRLPGP
jgi:AcrR family transcriptional regulator